MKCLLLLLVLAGYAAAQSVDGDDEHYGIARDLLDEVEKDIRNRLPEDAKFAYYYIAQEVKDAVKELLMEHPKEDLKVVTECVLKKMRKHFKMVLRQVFGKQEMDEEPDVDTCRTSRNISDAIQGGLDRRIGDDVNEFRSFVDNETQAIVSHIRQYAPDANVDMIKQVVKEILRNKYKSILRHVYFRMKVKCSIRKLISDILQHSVQEFGDNFRNQAEAILDDLALEVKQAIGDVHQRMGEDFDEHFDRRMYVDETFDGDEDPN